MCLWASLPAFRMEGSEIPLWFAKSSKGANRVKWVAIIEEECLQAVSGGCAVVVYCDRGLSSIATDLSHLWWHRLVFITSLITPTKIRQFSDICKKKSNYFHSSRHFFPSVTMLQRYSKISPYPTPIKYSLYLYIYKYKSNFSHIGGSQKSL